MVKISSAIHLDLLHSESRYMHRHTHIVLSAELSGIQCESKHNAPEHKAPEQLFFNTTRQYFRPSGASEILSGEDSPG